MKTKFLLIPALLLGATALGGAAVALAHKNVARVAKAAELSPWTITDDMYECAFLEQYNDVANCISTEDYSYANDKPIGNNTIGGHLYGTYGPVPNSLKQTNYLTNLMGVNETLQWRISGLNVKGKDNPNRLYVQLENNSSNWNICKESSFPNSGDTADFYAIGQLIVGKGYAKGAAMITNTPITNIQDLSFFWRSSYTQKVYIVYQLDGQTEWKILDGTGSSDGNYTGTHGWDAKGYTTFSSGSWTTKELYGATAKVGLACTEAPTESGSIPVSAVLINANKAAVRYVNMLSFHEHVCSSNGTDLSFDLSKGQSDKVHNQDLFQLATERAEGSFLGDYINVGTKTSEYFVLGLYNHLVTSIPALGSVKTASSNYFMNMTNNASVVIIVSISVAAAAVLGTGLFFGLRKRKHN